MGTLALELLPLALVSMLIPLWIVIEVRVLSGARGLGRAIGLVSGMTGTRLVQGLAFALVASEAAEHSEESTHWLVSGVLLVLGIVLLVAAARLLLGEPDPDAAPPRWAALVDSMGTGKAVGVGAGLVAVNTKAWVLTLSALGVIAEAGLGRGAQAGAYLAFIVAAQAVLLGLILVSVVVPRRARRWVAALSAWLERHSRVISIVVALLFGAYFVVKGLTGLLTG